MDKSKIEDRTFTGFDNNLKNQNWGKANIELLRISGHDYPDGIGSPSGLDRPTPRVISNSLCFEKNVALNENLTDFMWAWGQFLDHELDHTPENEDEKLKKDLLKLISLK